MVNHGSTMGKNGNIAGFSIDIYTGRRQFGSQTSDKMDRWKSRDDSSQRRERVRREEVRRERVSSTSRKKIKVREKVAKSRNTLFFQCLKMLKAPQCRSTFGSSDVENVHAVVARSTYRSEMVKTPHVRSTFESWDVAKVHAVVARSAFASQNV